MTIRPRERKRTLSKHVSSFNMWMDQVYQVRAIMEATGAVKDASVPELGVQPFRFFPFQSRGNLLSPFLLRMCVLAH